jgi:hypothetical protein
MAAMILGMLAFNAGTPGWVIAISLLIFGQFRSLQFSSLNTLAYADVGDAIASRATSVASVAQQLSMSFGVVISTCVLALISGGEGKPSMFAFHGALIANALLMLLPILGFLKLHRDDGDVVCGHRQPAEQPAK